MTILEVLKSFWHSQTRCYVIDSLIGKVTYRLSYWCYPFKLSILFFSIGKKWKRLVHVQRTNDRIIIIEDEIFLVSELKWLKVRFYVTTAGNTILIALCNDRYSERKLMRRWYAGCFRSFDGIGWNFNIARYNLSQLFIAAVYMIFD